MKLMTPVLIALLSLSAVAQQLPPLDPARQAERDARDRQNAYARGEGERYDREHGYRDDRRGSINGPGYIVPGQPPPMMPPRRPPMPPPPPPGYPSYPGPQDYGPAYTARWQDFGVTKMPKVIEQEINLDLRGQFVNEILLRSVDNSLSVTSVLVYLTNGQVIDLRQATGSIGGRGEIRTVLDYRASLRVNRIVVKATSGLIGSRGSLNVVVGLAY